MFRATSKSKSHQLFWTYTLWVMLPVVVLVVLVTGEGIRSYKLAWYWWPAVKKVNQIRLRDLDQMVEGSNPGNRKTTLAFVSIAFVVKTCDKLVCLVRALISPTRSQLLSLLGNGVEIIKFRLILLLSKSNI